MSKKKTINYKETFTFPDIPVLYPVYALSESGKVMNFKSISYPTPKSKKKFTRNKQLSQRSMQAKIFDAFINVGYFDPLIVYREFPVIIQNALRLPGQNGMYIIQLLKIKKSDVKILSFFLLIFLPLLLFCHYYFFIYVLKLEKEVIKENDTSTSNNSKEE